VRLLGRDGEGGGRRGVPDRTCRCCPPPWINGTTVADRASTSAPMPIGPPILCALTLSAARPVDRKSIGTCPYAATASQCTGTPWAAASATTSSTGCIVPTSLLAQSSVTSATSSCSSRAAASASSRTRPRASSGIVVTTAPS
jgi:hypothetical protein